MPSLTRLTPWLIPLLLLVLTVVAGYALVQIRSLSLPIPQALGLFTVVLPLITGISTRGVNGLIKRSARREQGQPTIRLIAIIGFQLIYETVVATLALTHILPPNSLDCGLNERWQQLFVGKHERAIKDIQNAFECCGFRTVKDRAWPFPTDSASPCAVTHRRTKSCAGDWRKAEQITAGLFLLVALVVFIIKVLAVIFLLTNRSEWAGWPKTQDRENATESRGSTTRLIEAGESEEPYHDEPVTAQESGTNHDQRPILPSSFLQNDSDNAWRGEGEGASHRT